MATPIECGHHVAHLWLAPGVLLLDNLAVPSPPPSSWYIHIMPPCNWIAAGPSIPPAVLRLQTAEFRLVDYSPSGDVAHYELVTRPPDGFRWLAIDGALCTERVR